MDKKNTPKNMDEYINSFPETVQGILQKIRQTIHEAVPDATEGISYQMPVFHLNGNLVYFAAFKNHIGFYPAPTGIEAFKEKLSKFEGGKGSVKFPLDKPIPYDLIREIVLFRAVENQKKAANKPQKKAVN